jgi:hypothetical protein
MWGSEQTAARIVQSRLKAAFGRSAADGVGGLSASYPQDFPRTFPLVPTVVKNGSLSLTGSLRAGSGLYLRVLQGPRGGADTLHVNAGVSPLPTMLVPQFAVIRIR